MKKLLIPLIFLVVSLIAAGCSTMTEPREERNRRLSQISDLQMKMLVEDWDYLWLYERNTGMTRWCPWVGI